MEVSKMRKVLFADQTFQNKKEYLIVDTSSPPSSLDLVFAPSSDKRKIILSTEVAETSISVDDVVSLNKF